MIATRSIFNIQDLIYTMRYTKTLSFVPKKSKKKLHPKIKKAKNVLRGRDEVESEIISEKVAIFNFDWRKLQKFLKINQNKSQSWLKIGVKKNKHKFIKKISNKHRQAAKKKARAKFRKSLAKKTKLILVGLIFLFTLFVGGLLYLMRDLPSPAKLTSGDNYDVSTQIFDRNGKLLYEIFADENRIPINLEDLPPVVLQATIAIEDKRFYKHWGFDIVGISRALYKNFQGGRIEGGSTITQQLVKNALLTREKTIKRKVKEGILAVLTEVLYSKEEILEMYLNYISYGGTAVGIESASNHYFDKHAKDLTLAEASLLAGLPQAPSRYSPFASDGEQSKARQKEVLSRMAEDGYISNLEVADSASQTLDFALKETDIKAPHFVFYVRDLLYEKYGVEKVEKGGLRVRTSLDLDLHNVVQASLSAEIANLKRYKVGNGAAMVIRPGTGEILSMVGSKDYFDNEEDGQVNVTLAQRQPGSSIKPLTYATAFQNKLLNPGTILLDVPTCFEVAGQPLYCPRNYDGTFKGPVTVRDSLGNSLNIPAVKALKIIGVENFMSQAQKMGISTWKDPSFYGLSLTLGGGEVRMIDMAQAFGVLANGGVRTPLVPILEIRDYRDNSIESIDLEARTKALEFLTEYDGEEIADSGVDQELELTRAMDKAPAYLAAHIMQDNNARLAAFGSRSELVIPGQVVSAKTGTTNDLKDNWTVGFTPEFLTITWVGNNDNTSMNQYLVSGVTGAAPIWNDIMSYILEGREPIWQEKPSDVKSVGVCATGAPPGFSSASFDEGAIGGGEENSSCQVRYTELFWEESLASRSKVRKTNTWIRAETGLPPEYGDENTEGLVLEEHEFYSDPVFENYCSDCSRAVDEEGKIIYEKSIVKNTNLNGEDKEN